jgi:hypothetical protein
MIVDRRGFLGGTALAGGLMLASEQALAASPAGEDMLRWLDGAPPPFHEGVTWGTAWPRGAVKAKAALALTGAAAGTPVQSWPTAYWPDGSVKWSAHAIPASDAPTAPGVLRAAKGPKPAAPVSVSEDAAAITISTGPVRWVIAKSGAVLIRSADRGGKAVLRDIALTASAQDRPDEDDAAPAALTRYAGRIAKVTVEQGGPVRAVVKIDGTHSGAGRDWLPFSLRLYFHAGSAAVRIVHSFIFDGDETKDFIRGLGLTGAVPMADAAYDRHVRFAGQDGGLWGEAVQTLTGLRRDPGDAFKNAQVAGRKVPPLDGMAPAVRKGLPYVPHWGDFTLSQPNADGFTITKRTKAGHGWIDVDGGARAAGLGYVGGVSGGVAFAMHDFWQRGPVRLDIRDAQTDLARFALWYHAPDAPAMDLRFYHDGMGMTDHFAENEGLDITYEDYERGWGTPHGVARTTEFMLWALDATPARDRLAGMAALAARPPRIVPAPEAVHKAGVFGDWSLPDRSTPARSAIEDQNAFLLRFYRQEVDKRRWYGFWNYGDVMHSYDADRHVWRYDVGGFAWDNSELSPDLWLWYSFLRSGDPEVFRMAEAMTRHTGEVDVYHLGRFKGLGTRHGVQHWSDSSKQPRVSNAIYRRIYYYLTADERTGDLMRELLDSDHRLATVDINRKVAARPQGSPNAVGTGAVVADKAAATGEVMMGFGTSWCSLLGAWLAEWERTGNTRWRNRIVNGMTSLAALPKQWFAGGANFDLATGRFTGPGDKVSVSHLNAVFGAVEINSELLTLLDVPAYRDAWLDYCATYNAPRAEFVAKTGGRDSGRNLQEGHSRLTAYAARQRHDVALARRAWAEFHGGAAGLGMGVPQTARPIGGADVLNPVEEVPRISTNASAQWGLAAIQNLALVGEFLDPTPPPPRR